ncbi:hypothetical protein FRB97_003082 [Tulasnella sp. 331]|nr:hypothetical protein FRB97_003082 [Tulasnella sp. 331]
MREIYPFDSTSTKVLDFACGTGIMSQHMAPFCREIHGADISQKMVDVYNEKAQATYETKDKLKASVVDLASTSDNGLGGQEFDVIMCGHAYHHFQDPVEMTKKLVSYLRPGTGTLLILDRITNEAVMHLGAGHGGGHHHHHHHGETSTAETIEPESSHHLPQAAFSQHHAGFEETDIKTLFEGADLADFTFVKMPGYTLLGIPMDLFVAKGVRPSL